MCVCVSEPKKSWIAIDYNYKFIVIRNLSSVVIHFSCDFELSSYVKLIYYEPYHVSFKLSFV